MRDTLIAARMSKLGRPTFVVLNLDFEQQGDVWVGTCFELGTSTFADTLVEARDEVGDAVLLQLNEVARLGFMTEYLREHGVAEMVMDFTDTAEPADQWGLLAGARA